MKRLFTLKKIPRHPSWYTTSDGYFRVWKEPRPAADTGRDRWFISATGRGWEDSDDSLVGSSAGYSTKAEAVEALDAIYAEGLAMYFLTGDLAEAGGCLLDFEYSAEYLKRLGELPGIDQQRLTELDEKVKKHQQEVELLRLKGQKVRESLEALWNRVLAEYSLKQLQEATGHDWDE